jgi:ABC-2 type transport system ATP-binding protein
MLTVEKHLKTQIRRLSLGERMKMELIATLLHAPKIVFLDEPTIGLDLGAQNAIRKFILDYRVRYQPAMILTSHYMEDIKKCCERIVFIQEGRFVYDGALNRVTSRFAQNKVLTAVLEKPIAPGADQEKIRSFGKILSLDSDTLKIEMDRSKIAEATSFLLNSFSVLDLSIEEPDITSIIESLMKNSGSLA